MLRRTAILSSLLLISTSLIACAEPPAPEEEETGEALGEQVVCPAGSTIQGIDVSVWQADIDWAKVKAAGIKFAFARAAYSTSKDKYFDQNWSGMKAAGIVRGAYQYWLPDEDPIAQADAMVQIMGALQPGDLPPVVDVEETGGLGPSAISSRLGQWLDHIKSKTGRKAIIYSGKYFWQDNVKSTAFLDYPLWIPNYSLDCPDLASGYWDNWQFFQYTSTGSVNGVSGNVDRDTFNGTLQDLQAFASAGSAKYAAQFVSQSFPYASKGPQPVVGGTTFTLTLEMKNVGTEPWDEKTRLATTGPRDRESAFAGPEWPGANRYAQVQGKVMPGETYKFTWDMHAPLMGGVYDEHIGMVEEGVTWFSDKGQGGPPDDQLEGLFEVMTHVETGKVNVLAQVGPGEGSVGGTGNDGAAGDSGSSGGAVHAQGSCSTGGGGGGATSATFLLAVLSASGLLRRRSRSAPPSK